MNPITMKLVAATTISALSAFAVPAAQASFQGPPDAIDRYNAAQTVPFEGPPDAIDRYNEARAVPFNGPPDAIDRYAGRTGTFAAATPDTTSPVVATASSGLDWGAFGIGAGAMLGLLLLAAVIGLGALSMRHRSGTLRTS